MSFWLGRISHMRRLTVLSSWPSDLPLNLDDLDGTAKKLLEIVKGAEGLPENRWPHARQVFRGCATEIVVAQAANGEPLSDAAINLLIWATDLPTHFLDDPVGFFSGRKGGGRPRGSYYAEELAMMCDWHHQSQGLPLLSLKALQKKLADLGVASTRASLRAWRAKPEYQEAVTFKRSAEDAAIAHAYESAAQGEPLDETGGNTD